MSRIGHLTRRLLGSLRPGGPSEPDRAWVESVLSEEEYGLWSRMYGPDRRHSAAVAREVERRLGHEASSPVLAAALLHDVGKIDADLRTWGRVVATLSAAVAGPDTARLWIRGSGFTRRVGLYLHHPEIGADMLELAGSDPLTVAWAEEHHKPREEWTVPPHIAEVLHEVDDD
ncbi:MAG: HD domain-containing protein [Actinobacteria bacterium]|nr:HD domain-containing protein [Actinomycetota bacterium]NIS33003.1 HD domain-containing protein [Actinomycetota bacterium]NIT96589.1 HD domain-containing protein [Actinomycetota bacterium]NIU20284.1 HD domain-containing protein [Actinomycetota bacterium]NIU67938.1 HD domain-containing protein [Actinomycetota bacterium]